MFYITVANGAQEYFRSFICSNGNYACNGQLLDTLGSQSLRAELVIDLYLVQAPEKPVQ